MNPMIDSRVSSCLMVAAVAASCLADSTRPVEGIRRNIPAVHALKGAKIIVRSGKTIDNGTIVIRDGVIVDVGDEVEIPSDAHLWDVAGKTIYPGFIDAYSELDIDPQRVRGATSYWNAQIVPELHVVDQWDVAEGNNSNKTFRELGLTVRLVAPDEGIVRGVSLITSTSDAEADQAIIQHAAALHVRLGANRESRGYPSSPMGAVALARQSFYDAQWYDDVWRAYRTQRGLPRPEQNRSLESLHTYVESGGPLFFNTPDEQYLARANAFAREFGLNAVIVGSGQEYRRLEDVKASGRTVVVPLQFPEAPNVASPESAVDATLEQLMHWDLAPENAGRLDEAGVTIVLTAHGLKKPDEFWKAVRTTVKRGLKSEAALRALTETPARLLGIEDRVGTLEPGKVAHLVVADGNLFESEASIDATWVDGERFEIESPARHDIRGAWGIQTNPNVVLEISGKADALEGQAVSGEAKTDLRKPRVDVDQFFTTFDGSVVGQEGIVRLSAVILKTDERPTLTGNVAFPNGSNQAFTATWSELKEKGNPDEGETTEKENVGETTEGETTEGENVGENEKVEGDDLENRGNSPSTNESENSSPAESGESDSQIDLTVEKPSGENEIVQSSFDVNYPLGAFGIEEPITTTGTVAFAHGTVWTSGPQGVMENTTLLIQDGKILTIGSDVEIPDEATIINCEGKHLTPGIIDCHSHMATDGGVNEGSQAITAEVRIGDFIDANDVTIYRQLAGGVTTANILHGSANPIGGQNQVIKLRWGSNSDGLKFKEAPAGIKFALGENVKRSNSRSSNRYPRTRMGVEQIIRDSFLAARQYRDRWIAWQNDRSGLPPRRDLELDALVEILENSRWIHCHSYRQDEILALLRTLESFNVRIGTLQHILEGYKIAEAMKRHGAMGSSFSDWWAYKFEVYDAIPYNGSIMHNVGIDVSFNSDDRELARHLNHEAAKAVKYGGVEVAEALKFVTLNPAKQLRIDNLVGSLEQGKQADLVVWSAEPLSTLSRCEQTWIDGRKYFDRAKDIDNRKKWDQMRRTLIQKILQSGSPIKKDAEGNTEIAERDYWPRIDIYCTHRGQVQSRGRASDRSR